MKRALLLSAIAFAALTACSDNNDNAPNKTEATADTPRGEQGDPGSESISDRSEHDRDEPEVDQDMAYHYSQGERGPVLSFGVPRTDNIALNLRCPPDAMGKTVLVSFRRSAETVAQRPSTITLEAGNATRQLAIATRETELGTMVEAAAVPDSPVMQAYRNGAALSVAYGDETVTIPSRSSDREIGAFFSACRA